MTASGLLVHFAGSAIRFHIGHPDLLKAIQTHFEHCLGEGGQIVAEFEVATTNDGVFSLRRDGELLQRSLGFEGILRQLMQDGLTQLNGASHTHLILHSAAVAHRNRGLLLCGKSGCGKSTLTAGLVAGGFQYLTDEVIALPAQDGAEILGLCRSLALKKESSFIWEPLLPPTSDDMLLFRDGEAWIAPTLLNASSVRATIAPALLVFARYQAESAFEAGRLTTADALFRLLQCLVNARNFSDSGMGAAARLARLVPAFSLTYSDIESAGEWIQHRIEAG